MESALADKSDLQSYHKEAKELETQFKIIRMKKEELEADTAQLETIQSKEYQVEHLHNKKIRLIHEFNDLQNKKNELSGEENDEGYAGLGDLFQ